jgi:hypothetical protein
MEDYRYRPSEFQHFSLMQFYRKCPKNQTMQGQCRNGTQRPSLSSTSSTNLSTFQFLTTASIVFHTSMCHDSKAQHTAQEAELAINKYEINSS